MNKEEEGVGMGLKLVRHMRSTSGRDGRSLGRERAGQETPVGGLRKGRFRWP